MSHNNSKDSWSDYNFKSSENKSEIKPEKRKISETIDKNIFEQKQSDKGDNNDWSTGATYSSWDVNKSSSKDTEKEANTCNDWSVDAQLINEKISEYSQQEGTSTGWNTDQGWSTNQNTDWNTNQNTGWDSNQPTDWNTNQPTDWNTNQATGWNTDEKNEYQNTEQSWDINHNISMHVNPSNEWAIHSTKTLLSVRKYKLDIKSIYDGEKLLTEGKKKNE
ncbi:hypothetical protein CWI36_0468p0010 [Hamiltosporidium magnivora]|uniref:Uncharacterized protein n=1 Tax=Hamiltosporidium magnivora TaxID=148818 RepID=A0A4Q9LGP6_9MICR|nr:hypothetical protein CWI36_0468p0010 [Hamiltosporidium magnivora]